MVRPSLKCIVLSIILLGVARCAVCAQSTQGSEQGDLVGQPYDAQPFLDRFCIACHGGDEAEAGFHVDDLKEVASGHDVERWEKILELVSIDDMPPEDAGEQPKLEERRRLIAGLTSELRRIGRGPDEARLVRPEFGNRVRHEDLFSGEFQGPASSPARLWRKTPQIYSEFERSLRLKQGTNPFQPKGGKGFQDYAILPANESTISAMRISASGFAAELLEGRLVYATGEDGKPDKSRRVRDGKVRFTEFRDLLESQGPPSDDSLTGAITRSFEVLLNRKPAPQDLERYQPFLRRSIEIAGARQGLESLLTVIMLSPEFVYRMELGLGELQPDGRRRLSPGETAYAIAFALTDRPPDPLLLEAAKEGRLETKEDVAREVRRLLSVDTRPYWSYEVNHTFQSHLEACPNPRVLRFFREFFDYAGVFEVFKDTSRNSQHKPNFLFKDADLLVLSVLERDRQVLKELLTTDRYVVHYVSQQQADRKLKSIHESITKQAELARQREGKPSRPDPIAEKIARGLMPVLGGYRGGRYYTAYNLEQETWDYPIEQPFRLPNRFGMLTHPAWLVAHSGNFATDPIRRGKWIREHLLADTIPEIPIGVDAALEDDPHKTVREKLEKTTGESCWRCHKKMNPLGLPFEAYDDFGAYREQMSVDTEGNVIASVFESEALEQRATQRKQPSPIASTIDVDTTGFLMGTGDSNLDGSVEDVRDLVQRLAASDRVRQSFIRHAFRYWMGRNETLTDSPTLMAADRAYVESDGSFKELLVSLLTSDSFLMRRD